MEFATPLSLTARRPSSTTSTRAGSWRRRSQKGIYAESTKKLSLRQIVPVWQKVGVVSSMIVSGVVKEQFEKASPKRPPKKPRLSENTRLRTHTDSLEMEDFLELSELRSHHYQGDDLSGIRVSKAIFSGDMFLGCELEGALFEDAIFERCDFSNSTMASTGFIRCEFKNCKLIGASFFESLFDDVTVASSNFSMSSFSHSRWKNVACFASEFDSTDMSEMQLAQVSFTECNLKNATLFRTNLMGIDLTSSRIDGVVVSDSMDEIKGSKMDLYQAADFARKLGVLISD